MECENKNLSALPEGIYAPTQVLNISGNRLGVLPRDVFRGAGLLDLQRIYVRNSRLRQIDPLAFNELINLVELDLSDNLLTAVPTNAFKSTQFLRYSILSNDKQVVKTFSTPHRITTFTLLSTSTKLGNKKVSKTRVSIKVPIQEKKMYGIHRVRTFQNQGVD